MTSKHLAPPDLSAKNLEDASLNKPGSRRSPVKRRESSLDAAPEQGQGAEVVNLRGQPHIQAAAVDIRAKRIASLLSDDDHKYSCAAVLEAIWRLGCWKVRAGKRPRITANGIVARINEDDELITTALRREQSKGACNLVSSSKKLLEQMGLVAFKGQALTGLAGENLNVPEIFLHRNKVDKDKVREFADGLVLECQAKRRKQNADAHLRRQAKRGKLHAENSTLKLHADSENSTLKLHADSENSTLTLKTPR